MAQQIVEFKKFDTETIRFFNNQKEELNSDYTEFMAELRNVSRAFGYENPAEFGKTAEILTGAQKDYKEQLNYINSVLEQGGVKITKDITKLNAVLEHMQQRIIQRQKDMEKRANGEM